MKLQSLTSRNWIRIAKDFVIRVYVIAPLGGILVAMVVLALAFISVMYQQQVWVRRDEIIPILKIYLQIAAKFGGSIGLVFGHIGFPLTLRMNPLLVMLLIIFMSALGGSVVAIMLHHPVESYTGGFIGAVASGAATIVILAFYSFVLPALRNCRAK